jgi:hypothetical protein
MENVQSALYYFQRKRTVAVSLQEVAHLTALQELCQVPVNNAYVTVMKENENVLDIAQMVQQRRVFHLAGKAGPSCRPTPFRISSFQQRMSKIPRREQKHQQPRDCSFHRL